MTVAKARRGFFATINIKLIIDFHHQGEGIIKAVNTDARKIITRGEPANFFVYYLVDDDMSKHNLTLDGYGADDRWVGAARADRLRGALVWLWIWFS